MTLARLLPLRTDSYINNVSSHERARSLELAGPVRPPQRGLTARNRPSAPPGAPPPTLQLGSQPSSRRKDRRRGAWGQRPSQRTRDRGAQEGREPPGPARTCPHADSVPSPEKATGEFPGGHRAATPVANDRRV